VRHSPVPTQLDHSHLYGMQGRIENAMFIVVDLQLDEMLSCIAVKLELGAGKII
jgi:hypothetical protein